MSKTKIFKDRRTWMRSIACRLDLRSSAEVVAFVISEFCNPKTGEAYVSFATIAETSGLSERTTSRAICQLLKERILLKRPLRRGRYTNTYRLLLTRTEKIIELTKTKTRRTRGAIERPVASGNFNRLYQERQNKIIAEACGTVEGFSVLQKFDDGELREAYRQSTMYNQSILEVARHLAKIVVERGGPDDSLGPFQKV